MDYTIMLLVLMMVMLTAFVAFAAYRFGGSMQYKRYADSPQYLAVPREYPNSVRNSETPIFSKLAYDSLSPENYFSLTGQNR